MKFWMAVMYVAQVATLHVPICTVLFFDKLRGYKATIEIFPSKVDKIIFFQILLQNEPLTSQLHYCVT